MADPSGPTSGDDPELRRRFDSLRAEWERHLDSVLLSSRPGAALECTAFLSLVEMGTEISAMIFEVYEDVEIPWGAVLARIHQIDTFGDGVSGDVTKTRRRWFEWRQRRL